MMNQNYAEAMAFLDQTKNQTALYADVMKAMYTVGTIKDKRLQPQLDSVWHTLLNVAVYLSEQ